MEVEESKYERLGQQLLDRRLQSISLPNENVSPTNFFEDLTSLIEVIDSINGQQSITENSDSIVLERVILSLLKSIPLAENYLKNTNQTKFLEIAYQEIARSFLILYCKEHKNTISKFYDYFNKLPKYNIEDRPNIGSSCQPYESIISEIEKIRKQFEQKYKLDKESIDSSRISLCKVLRLPDSTQLSDIIDEIQRIIDLNESLQRTLHRQSVIIATSPQDAFRSEIQQSNLNFLEAQEQYDALVREKNNLFVKTNQLQNQLKLSESENYSLKKQIRKEGEDMESLRNTLDELTKSLENSKSENDQLKSRELLTLSEVESLKAKLTAIESKAHKSDEIASNTKKEMQNLLALVKDQTELTDDMKLKLEALELENSELKKYPRKEETKQDNSQSDSFNFALDILSEEMSELTGELNNESALNSKLVIMVHKQQLLIELMGTELSKLKNVKPVVQQSNNQHADKNIIDSLTEIAKSLPETVRSSILSSLSDDSNPPNNRAISSFKILSSQFSDLSNDSGANFAKKEKEINKIKAKNSQLAGILYSISRFVQNIADNSEIKSSLLTEATDPSELRISLLKTDEFITDHCEALKDGSIFDALMTSSAVNIARAFDKVRFAFENNGFVDDGALALAASLIAANAVMRRFADNARAELSAVSTEIRRINVESESIEKLRREKEGLKAQLEEATAAKEELQAVVDTLKESAVGSFGDSEIREALDRADASERGNIETINNLQETVDALSEKLEKKTSNSKKLKNALKKVISENQKLNDNIEKLSLENDRAKNEIESFRKMANEHKETLELEKARITLDYEQKMMSLEDEKRSMKSDFDLKVHQLITEHTDKIESLKSESKCAVRAARDSENMALRRVNELKSKYDEIVAEYRKRLETESKQSELLQKRIKTKDKDLKELNSRLTTLQIEFRTQSMKSNSEIERLKRSFSSERTNLELKVATITTKSANDISRIKNRNEAEKEQIIMSISKLFGVNSEKCDLDSIVKAAAQKYSSLSKEVFRLKAVEADADAARAALNVLNSDNIADAVLLISADLRAEKQKNNDLQKRLEEALGKATETEAAAMADRNARAWEEWAHRAYVILTRVPAPAMPAEELRQALEIALLSAEEPARTAKVIDSLKRQKKLALLTVEKSEIQFPSTTVAMDVVIAVVRMQLLSGHAKSPLSMPRSGEKQKPILLHK